MVRDPQFPLEEGDRVWVPFNRAIPDDGVEWLRGAIVAYDWSSSFVSILMDNGHRVGQYARDVILLSPLELLAEL